MAPSERESSGTGATPELAPSQSVGPDLQAALLVALVLVPGSYSRNRFEGLFRQSAVREVRGRATMVRSIIGDLVQGICGQRAQFVRCDEGADGGAALVYRVPAVGLCRTAWLSTLELSLVRFVVTRALGPDRSPPPSWQVANGLRLLCDVPPPSASELAAVLACLLDPRRPFR